MASNVSAALGAETQYSRTVSESDVYLFAGISGDHSPNHVDEAFMRGTPYGKRIAHGALLVAFMSRCSTEIVAKCGALAGSHFPVSLGYDRIRFLKAVTIGDTITVRYKMSAVDEAKVRTLAEVQVLNEAGDLCAVATHVMSWLPRT
ncbi:MAG: dehydratase [Proteobacteria bacterium]|nr:dehydratase [Pseudomonadota bacterium]